MNEYWSQNQQPPPQPYGPAPTPPQAPYGAMPPAHEPPPSTKKRGWIVPLVSGLGGLVVGVGIGVAERVLDAV